MRVLYDKKIYQDFANPEQFQQFCNNNQMKVVWEDNLQEVKKQPWYSRRRHNMLIVHASDLDKIRQAQGHLTIKPADRIDRRFDIFKPCHKEAKAIVFDKNHEKVRALFSGDKHGLKIEDARWSFLSFGGNLLILNDREFKSKLEYIDDKVLYTHPFFRLTAKNRKMKKLNNSKGAVVLSMNQTNSFSQFSHEILQFLLMGVSVFA